MRIIIRDDSSQVADYVAKYVMDRINAFGPTLERPFVLGLPTGSSPLATYKKLIEFYQQGLLSFKHVVTFNMDEYCGLPEDHAESYHSFMFNNFFHHIDIVPSNVNILNGNAGGRHRVDGASLTTVCSRTNDMCRGSRVDGVFVCACRGSVWVLDSRVCVCVRAADLKVECEQYEAKMKSYGGVELFLGGIGSDGHMAFNEPGSSLVSRTRIKTLAYDTIVANARFFGNDITRVPKTALTVGVGTVMDAREVLFIITGPHKAYALRMAVEEGVSHMWTVSAIQMHANAMIVCDEDATLELRVKTVKYFKGIERVQTKPITE
eukprot:TRINITY_DN4037_c0_g1_i3.p1 TRINITY_DN4037_c0_g1~~TRINITY_DN4037_c0_g1_i3.p1  ORF type:complete len:321 (-),score=61.01 TRINITY_DN4037_c0_g1_i3:222-1184(-)